MNEHPWQSSRDKFESEILPKLEKYGMEIGEKAAAGNETAKKIISHYTLLYRSFDPLTLIMLEESLVEYGI